MTAAPVSGRYLPFLRRGVSADVSTDAGGGSGQRANVEVVIRLSSGGTFRDVRRSLALAGPGDLISLADGVVSRMYPLPDVFDAEPNYFALVEFRQADLPWRYTPSRTPRDGDASRLMPWLRLIVLSDAELGDNVSPATSTKPLPSVVITSPSTVLPPADQAWAWAHVEVKDEVASTPVSEVLDHNPERFVARLMCPRKLVARTAYTAMVVPVFQRGRMAGLGLDPGNVDASERAWNATSTRVELPIYYRWRFGTGAEGDFEALVRRLEPRELPAGVGVRRADMSDPGFGLPSASSSPMRLESALEPIRRSETTSPGPIGPAEPAWDPAQRGAFVDAITSLLNLAGTRVRPPTPGTPELGDTANARVLTPPLYGEWHGERSSVDDRVTDWFSQLNTNPVSRAAAGAGTSVVQAHDDAFVAAAWRQFEDIARINQSLRFAQVAREGAAHIYARDVIPLSLDGVIAFATPVLNQIMHGGSTVHAALRASPIPAGILDPQWRKLTRPRGPIGLRQNRPDAELGSLLDRLNRGLLRLAPPPPPPTEALSLLGVAARAASLLGRGVEAQAVRDAARDLCASHQLLSAIGLFRRFTSFASPRPALEQFVLDAAGGRCDAAAVDAVLAEIPTQPNFLARANPGQPQQPIDTRPTVSGPDSESAAMFRQALGSFLRDACAPLIPARVRRPMDLGGAVGAVVAALDPRRTIPASLAARLRLSPGVLRGPDPLSPILGIPDLGIAMYAPLRDLSQEWILPGANDIPTNTMTVVRSNQAFIESFMTGVNHEFSRELLWREFPADLRGSFFRQFWDPGIQLDRSSSAAERRRDITAIHDWAENSPLGSHPVRPRSSTGSEVVLVIRGDVLRRYPQTTVYLTLVNADGSGSGTEWYPVFSGSLRPEAALRGFDVTDTEITRPAVDASPQYFFVLQEPVTESRFGLDDGPAAAVPSGRDGLAWSHVGLSGASYVDLGIETIAATPPGTASRSVPGSVVEPGVGSFPLTVAAGATSATVAFLTFQSPVRVLIAAREMLPTSGTGGTSGGVS